MADLAKGDKERAALDTEELQEKWDLLRDTCRRWSYLLGDLTHCRPRTKSLKNKILELPEDPLSFRLVNYMRLKYSTNFYLGIYGLLLFLQGSTQIHHVILCLHVLKNSRDILLTLNAHQLNFQIGSIQITILCLYAL